MFHLHSHETHAVTPGRFGQLSISDAANVRSLGCSWACHGSVWIDPAVDLDGVTYSPGPVPESVYLLGWIIAAAARPDGHVLMAGLGSGVGPIALAWAFPDLTVTVVEIDPAIIALARQWFPLLAYYEAQGRIRIVADDILAYVWKAQDADWSVACLDAYEDEPRLLAPSSLLQALHGRADQIWMNILEEDGSQVTDRYAALLIDTGWEPVAVMPVHDPHGDVACGNVLLSTVMPDRALLSEVQPFSIIDHPIARHADRQILTLLSHLRRWTRVQDANRDALNAQIHIV